jgi:hypothetical protein
LHFSSNPLMYFDTIWNLSSIGRQFKKDCDFVHAVAEEVIDKRRDALVILTIVHLWWKITITFRYVNICFVCFTAHTHTMSYGTEIGWLWLTSGVTNLKPTNGMKTTSPVGSEEMHKCASYNHEGLNGGCNSEASTRKDIT